MARKTLAKDEIVKGAEIPRSLAPDHKLLYVNSARFSVSYYDFKIFLGQISDIQGELHNNEIATLVMSPEHAKVFSELLARNIAKWEHTFGDIETPEGLISPEEPDQPTESHET
ncbi:MAG TPA: DUF3467 domain-containing protein [Thermoanaerobaculia bacterium]|nr:DUF3467 domain-containing protein [Thermoanaerobaculia bacterium]